MVNQALWVRGAARVYEEGMVVLDKTACLGSRVYQGLKVLMVTQDRQENPGSRDPQAHLVQRDLQVTEDEMACQDQPENQARKVSLEILVYRELMDPQP